MEAGEHANESCLWRSWISRYNSLNPQHVTKAKECAWKEHSLVELNHNVILTQASVYLEQMKFLVRGWTSKLSKQTKKNCVPWVEASFVLMWQNRRTEQVQPGGHISLRLRFSSKGKIILQMIKWSKTGSVKQSPVSPFFQDTYLWEYRACNETIKIWMTITKTLQKWACKCRQWSSQLLHNELIKGSSVIVWIYI